MKKFILLFLISILLPQVAFAAWWNPLSWKMFQRDKVENAPVKVIDKKQASPTSKSNDPVKTPSSISRECNPNYSGCLKQNAGDYDCMGGSGNGPNYTGTVQVLGYDEYRLDRDKDGWACE